MVFRWVGFWRRAYGVTVRNRAFGEHVWAGRLCSVGCEPVLVVGRLCGWSGCAASAYPWVSFPSQRFPSDRSAKQHGDGRYVGMDVHRELAQLAVLEDSLLRDEGRIGVTAEALRAWAGGLRADDQMALEATR